ncbi:MAG: hypothetical protein ACXV8I_01530 [Methylobacter sp.]
MCEVSRGFYALIASIIAAVPIIAMTRFMLYARTCRLISVLTFFNSLVRKWGRHLGYSPEQFEIQGVLVGQMRSYRAH